MCSEMQSRLPGWHLESLYVALQYQLFWNCSEIANYFELLIPRRNSRRQNAQLWNFNKALNVDFSEQCDPSCNDSVAWPHKGWRNAFSGAGQVPKRGRPGTNWCHHITHMPWSRLGVDSAELPEVVWGVSRPNWYLAGLIIGTWPASSEVVWGVSRPRTADTTTLRWRNAFKKN